MRTDRRTDGRTDTTKLIVAFYTSKAPKREPNRIRLRRCEGSPAGSAEGTAAVCVAGRVLCTRS